MQNNTKGERCELCGRDRDNHEVRHSFRSPEQGEVEEWAERIVMEYANISGRESEYRAFVRESARTVLPKLISTIRAEERERLMYKVLDCPFGADLCTNSQEFKDYVLKLLNNK